MLETTDAPLLRVSDLKQWVYCPRIFYYARCLPKVRPVTFGMEHGARAGERVEALEERRSLRAYGLSGGAREFNVGLASSTLGVRGVADMIVTADDGEVIPVDFKESDKAGDHFKLQVAAYALLLEEERGIKVARGFIYLAVLKRAEEVRVDARLRAKIMDALANMRRAEQTEAMPAPTPHISRCVSCEFRRFCNDVL